MDTNDAPQATKDSPFRKRMIVLADPSIGTQSIREIVDVLGGPTAVGKALFLTRTNVGQWSLRGKIPQPQVPGIVELAEKYAEQAEALGDMFSARILRRISFRHVSELCAIARENKISTRGPFRKRPLKPEKRCPKCGFRLAPGKPLHGDEDC